MKVSIIVPVGDWAKYGPGREALARSVARTKGCEWELVEVDDRAHRGVSWARNEGLRRATGDYVAWVDSDDEVEENWAEEIARALAKGPDVATIDAKLVGWKDRGDEIWGVKRPTMEKLRQAVYRNMTRSSALWLYVTRRELWEGLKFDETVKLAEDYLLLPKVLLRAGSCVYVDKPIYRYRCNEGSLINSVQGKEFRELLPPWETRMAEAPEKYRGACKWGVASSCYWFCDWAAVNDAKARAKGPSEAAIEECRWTIGRDFWWLMAEALRADDLSWRDRICWCARFVCAKMGWWGIQRWRKRRREERK